MKIHNLRTVCCAAIVAAAQLELSGQTNEPQLVDPNLGVRAVVTNLNQPTSMAFIGRNDFLVLEKVTGRVLRVVDGIVSNTVLDLNVNGGSERGLLGIALHPRFPFNPRVYLFWTESTTGADTLVLSETPLLGNRVDRFVWNGSTLTFETNIIRLRALQQDADQPERGNHDGGILRFGPDRKLYIYMGDNGRRGQMQNLPDGPGPAGNMPDDQFGGPEPDNAHLTGVILRLNDDGTAPRDNPFFRAGALRGGEAGANLQKVFAYGVRNGFGMAFDPVSGELWEAQNGDDSFTELNKVESGANLGWIQIMGPLARLAQFREIETSSNFFGLQQVRWSPTNIVDDPQEVLLRLFTIFEGGDKFVAQLNGRQEVPPVDTDAAAFARFEFESDGTLEYKVVALRTITQLIMGHIHLGARGQNGSITAFLFETNSPQDFSPGDVIASGTLDDDDVIALGTFDGTVSNLVERMRQGRAYVNLHTVAHPSGEIRGQIHVADRRPVSRYSDPEFSWKFEVAPAGLGFVKGQALGRKLQGDMIVGAARDFLEGGTLFRFELVGGRHRRGIATSDRRLRDRVADNLGKFDITESESLVFGTNFGVGTDIQTGPNGNLFIVSLTRGAIYEIFPKRPFRPPGHDRDDDDDHDHGRGNDDDRDHGQDNRRD